MKAGHTTEPTSPTVTGQPPSPALLFDTINAYQKTEAIKAAIELGIFTAIADGATTADAIARYASASPRGIRILCDYLTVLGFITKSGDTYTLTPDSALFLNRKSPAYAGGTLEFLLSPDLCAPFSRLTEATRKGGTASSEGTTAPNHSIWIAFARSMGPLMQPAAAALAKLVAIDATQSTRVLDISASHGAWGLAFARQYPRAHVVALDWAPVLEVSRQNAVEAGVADRFSTIPGSAFEADYGADFDVILLPNFLHHFSAADCVRCLRKVHAALRPGGTVAIVEFVPNPDRVTPPAAAGFSLVMLASTPEGDAYTFAEYAEMLRQAGFNAPVQHPLPASMNVALLATK